jgi:hypothetical protein
MLYRRSIAVVLKGFRKSLQQTGPRLNRSAEPKKKKKKKGNYMMVSAYDS